MKKIILAFGLFFCLTSQASTVQDRAARLGSGMNYPWLEEYWTGTQSIAYTDYLKIKSPAVQSKLSSMKKNLSLIKEMGFSTVRLPISFGHWENGVLPYTIDSVSYFQILDSAIKWTGDLKLNIIIDYHQGDHGKLTDSNIRTEKTRICDIWRQVALRYNSTDPDRVFFELYNEPNGVSETNWKSTALAIISSIRQVAPRHTLILGANNYNSQYNMKAILVPDTNIIYTFHFYEPFLFTHQGAAWVGGDVATTGMPFPYDPVKMPAKSPFCVSSFGVSQYNNYKNQATCDNMFSAINVAASFSKNYGVPILCGEWGTYKINMPQDNSRCAYTKCIKDILSSLKIPYCYWELYEDFSIFTNNMPAIENIPECLKSAMGINACYIMVNQNIDTVITRQVRVIVPCK